MIQTHNLCSHCGATVLALQEVNVMHVQVQYTYVAALNYLAIDTMFSDAQRNPDAPVPGRVKIIINK